MSVRKLAAGVVAVVSLLFAGGCTQVAKGAIKQSDFVKQFQSQKSVSKKWAECIGQELYADRPNKPKLTDEERKAFNSSKPKAAVTASIERKAEIAGATCDAKGLKP
jgi:hypothetical protein